MPLFALIYRYIDDVTLITEHRPEHRAYLRQLADAGELVLAGGLGEPGPPSGLLVVDVESVKRVEELADNDPFHARGIIKERSVQRWTLSIGEDRLGLRPVTAP
ncbi:YciI family protein [Rhodococcus sp. NPDC019627]|uniref:YciI family protein n=1 Tax=unclassified Rhodococcus (in: high G+C Gram-positive bacteria) TaxID=192944 RepID=UPI0033EB6196